MYRYTTAIAATRSMLRLWNHLYSMSWNNSAWSSVANHILETYLYNSVSSYPSSSNSSRSAVSAEDSWGLEFNAIWRARDETVLGGHSHRKAKIYLVFSMCCWSYYYLYRLVVGRSKSHQLDRPWRQSPPASRGHGSRIWPLTYERKQLFQHTKRKAKQFSYIKFDCRGAKRFSKPQKLEKKNAFRNGKTKY